MVRRANVQWSVDRLAQALSCDSATIEAELAAILVAGADGTPGPGAARLGRHVLRRHRSGWSCGPVGVYEHLRIPSAYEVERWVEQGDHAALDAALAGTRTPAPRFVEYAPWLRWRSGERLSSGARAWYFVQLLSAAFVFQSDPRDAARAVRGAAGLVEPALHSGDTINLARWVLSAKLPASFTARVPQTDAVIDWIAGQVQTGELSRTRALPLMGMEQVQARRWAFKWGELRSPRYPDAVSDERIEGLWPTVEDRTGNLAQWSIWIGEVLRRAMIEQRSWRLDEFHAAYLDHPTASAVAQGLVYVVGGLPIVFVEGRPHGVDGALQFELSGELRVAHPAEGTDHWPSVPGVTPFDQAGHPVLTDRRLPTVPIQPIAHRAWRQRVRSLRLLSDVDGRGATTAELWMLGQYRVRIDHAGYGTGLGGARPIENIRVSVGPGNQPPFAVLDADGRRGWDSLPRWLVSEVARMLRVLFGVSAGQRR